MKSTMNKLMRHCKFFQKDNIVSFEDNVYISIWGPDEKPIET